MKHCVSCLIYYIKHFTIYCQVHSPTFRFRGVFHHVKCFPIVQWQFQKCPLSVWERCLYYREFSYSKIIEKRQGPTPGVSPREMPVLGGVYMTPGWLSPRSEFSPVPSHGSIFVYMVPPQNVMPAQVTPAWVHPGSCTGARISLRSEISQRYHVNAKRPPVSVWIGLPVMFPILNLQCTLSTWSVPSNNEIWNDPVIM